MIFYLETIKRKSGIRYRIVRDMTVNGRRDRSYHSLPTGTTKETAKKICCEMNLNADFGDFLQKKSMLFRDYVEQIYFPKHTLYLSPTTKEAYIQMYKTKDGVRDYLGHYTLTEVTVEVLQDMVNRYVKMGKAPKIIRNYLYFISAILKEAMSDNYIKRQESTTCAFVRLPKPFAEQGNAYTISQVRVMLDRAYETKNRAMALYKNFKRFMKNICPDLPQFRLHDLRHTYFTLCSNVEGFSELSMIGTGGHSTVQSSKRYQHSQIEKMRDDMQKLDIAFAQAL